MQNNQKAGAHAPYDSIPTSNAAETARDSLLQKIAEENDLPALGGSVSRVVQLASSNDEAVRKLAYLVLSDVGLTQKILRMSNAVVYRTRSGTPITTVSKAIFLLGFDTVKTSALALMLVDGISGKRGLSVRQELSQALVASIFARELARKTHYRDAEEAAVAALFKNIGRVLVASHDHLLYKQIAELMQAGATPSQASLRVLGTTFDMITGSVLTEWNIPETIVSALIPLPGGVQKGARNRQEWMQQVVGFSAEAAAAMAAQSGAEGGEQVRKLFERFGSALNLDEQRIHEMFEKVREEASALTVNAGLPPPDGTAGDEAAHAAPGEASPELQAASSLIDFDAGDGALPEGLVMSSPDTGALNVDRRHPSGKPVNARELLLAGVQDVTEMMAAGKCSVNDMILLVLETLYRSLGFRFATVCLKDLKTGQFRARIALGEKNAERQAGFVFTANSKRDLFHLALEQDADLLISEATDPKIRDLIPPWHKALLPDARSFIVLPLVVHGKPLGMFYADRALPASEGVPPDETALIKTLKGQVITALHAR